MPEKITLIGGFAQGEEKLLPNFHPFVHIPKPPRHDFDEWMDSQPISRDDLEGVYEFKIVRFGGALIRVWVHEAFLKTCPGQADIELAINRAFEIA